MKKNITKVRWFQKAFKGLQNLQTFFASRTIFGNYKTEIVMQTLHSTLQQSRAFVGMQALTENDQEILQKSTVGRCQRTVGGRCQRTVGQCRRSFVTDSMRALIFSSRSAVSAVLASVSSTSQQHIATLEMLILANTARLRQQAPQQYVGMLGETS